MYDSYEKRTPLILRTPPRPASLTHIITPIRENHTLSEHTWRPHTKRSEKPAIPHPHIEREHARRKKPTGGEGGGGVALRGGANAFVGGASLRGRCPRRGSSAPAARPALGGGPNPNAEDDDVIIRLECTLRVRGSYPPVPESLPRHGRSDGGVGVRFWVLAARLLCVWI